MHNLDLYFTSSPDLQLVKTCFYFNYERPIITERGKCFPHSTKSGSFIWSNGVKALVYLLLQSVCLAQLGSANQYILSGTKKSLAHTLALTLLKEPNWLIEMCGVDINGKARARKLVNIRNPYYNLGEKVELSLNTQFLSFSQINFYLNNKKQTSGKNLLQLRNWLRASLQDSDAGLSLDSQIAQLGFDFL